ncbi:low molecular weight protein-tyrosine-phosphatase [Stomatohabitans albus]|uniref:low molecular weight protein-tyrosine-phosphatase n=1 Tax=Stomatohabitans albus TaxID=3110766 RepID=UPI00300C7C31
MADVYKVTMVCTGNICRSVMAEYIARDLIEKAGLSDQIEVNSTGTDCWHVGEGPDGRTIEVLDTLGIDARGHRSVKIDRAMADEVDLILVATQKHYDTIKAMGTATPIRLLREFDPELGSRETLDLADPWFGDMSDFESCLEEVQRSVVHWLKLHPVT